jgi:hypothetical protein
LIQRQLPHAVLEISRRIATWQKVMAPFAQRAGYTRWGAWLMASNPNLHRRSPMQVLRAGGTLNLADAAGDALNDLNFVREHESALISAILLQCPPPISFRWPPTRCTQIGARK